MTLSYVVDIIFTGKKMKFQNNTIKRIKKYDALMNYLKDGIVSKTSVP